MSVILRRYWFLLGLLVMIPMGLGVGYTITGGFVPFWLRTVNPRWITAVVLFLMTFTLDSRQFLVSLKSPVLSCLQDLSTWACFRSLPVDWHRYN